MPVILRSIIRLEKEVREVKEELKEIRKLIEDKEKDIE